MTSLNRREFLALGGRVAALLGLGAAAAPEVAEALEQLSRRAPVLWLQGQSCSGCSVSLLNADPVSPDRLVTEYIGLLFHQTLSAATGQTAVDLVNRTIDQGGYCLVVEGAVPARMTQACRFGDELFTQQLTRAARQAKAVVALGTCAAFGGVPAAENNPTGAMNVPAFLKQVGITTSTIRIPGCPPHPDWLLGTIFQLIKGGALPLDSLDRPKAFFGKTVHDRCPRFPEYERAEFARKFGEDGCLFQLGCQGPLTQADCTWRGFNSGTNTCIRAGAPCIGCAAPHFMAKSNYPCHPQGIVAAHMKRS